MIPLYFKAPLLLKCFYGLVLIVCFDGYYPNSYLKIVFVGFIYLLWLSFIKALRVCYYFGIDLLCG